MGAMKRYKEDLNGLRSAAEDIAVTARAVKPCEYHEDTLLDQYDGDALELAYKIANARVTKGEIGLDGFTRRDLTNMIQQVVNESADECYSCSRLFGPD